MINENKSQVFYQEIVTLLEKIKMKVTEESEVIWSGYDHFRDLHKEIDNHVERLKTKDNEVIQILIGEFAPTSTFQELSISNNWHQEYMEMAQEFDRIIEEIKNL